jgi:CDP-4-dehydro-6-deoxyglucose reductase
MENEGFEGIIENKIWVFVGARYEKDLFWKPKIRHNITYIPSLSRGNEDWQGDRGYVQDIVLQQNIDLKDAQVYACGSNEMIESARKLLILNSLEEHQFYSDAFVQTN